MYLLVLSFMIMTVFHVATWLAVVPVEKLQAVAVVRHPALLSPTCSLKGEREGSTLLEAENSVYHFPRTN